MGPSSFRLCPVRRPGPQLVRHSQRKRGEKARLNLRSRAPVLDPTKADGSGMPTPFREGRRQHGSHVIREWLFRSCVVSQNPRTLRNNMHENRDISCMFWSNDQDRSAKAINQTAESISAPPGTRSLWTAAAEPTSTAAAWRWSRATGRFDRWLMASHFRMAWPSRPNSEKLWSGNNYFSA